MNSADRTTVPPPPCNTGAENTQAFPSVVRLKPEAFIDAVSLTFRYLDIDWSCDPFLDGDDNADYLDNRVEAVKRLFGDQDNWKSVGGLYGYTQGVIQDGVRVMWHPGRLEMGLHVQAMGKACRAIATAPGFVNWPSWLSAMTGLYNAKFSRLDVAIDDATGLYAALPGVRAMADSLRRGHAVHRCQLKNCILTDNLAGAGDTLTLGDRTSETYIRCYDKGLEQGLPESENWVRVEIELKKDRADATARLIAESGLGCVSGLIRAALDFKRPTGGDSNVSRWKSEDWWDTFLGSAEAVMLSLPEPLRTVERSVAHIRHQYAPTIAALHYAARGNEQWWLHLVAQGTERLKDSQKRMVESFQQSGRSFNSLMSYQLICAVPSPA